MLSYSCGFYSIWFKGFPTSTFLSFLLAKTYKKSPPYEGWLSCKKLIPITLSWRTGEYLPFKNFIYLRCFSAILTGLFKIENVYSYFFYGCFYFYYFYFSTLDSSRIIVLSWGYLWEINEGFFTISKGISAYI